MEVLRGRFFRRRTAGARPGIALPALLAGREAGPIMADSAGWAAGRRRRRPGIESWGPMQGHLVVKPHRPRQARLLAGTVAVAALVAGFLLFEYGRHQGGYDTLTARAEQEQLRTRITELSG